MVEQITDMPAGTVGFRGKGELTEADFRDSIAPAIAAAVGDDGGVRLLLVTPPGFGSSDVPAVADLVRKSPESHLGHTRDWKRIAVVTESGALRRSSRIWTRMVPVDIKVFKPDEEPKARAWLLED
jgi:hypothetical protein